MISAFNCVSSSSDKLITPINCYKTHHQPNSFIHSHKFIVLGSLGLYPVPSGFWLQFVSLHLDFIFNIVKLGEPKFTVSHTIFLCCFLFLFFLVHNFKTSYNFSPKTCCENDVDIKNKTIISNWDLPQLGIKKNCKNVVTFCCVPRILFCVTFCCVPRLLFLFSQI